MTKFDTLFPASPAQMQSNVQPTRWNAETFQELLERFHQPLYRYFAVHTGGELDHAFRLALETLVIVFRKPELPDGTVLPSWIFEIAWEALNLHYSRLEPTAVSTQSHSLSGNDAQFSRMREAFRKLAFYRREALYLRIFAGLELKDIAILMDQSETTIQALTYQGVNELSALVENRKPVLPPRRQLRSLAQDYHDYLTAVLQGLPVDRYSSSQMVEVTRQLMDLRIAISMKPEAAASMKSQLEQIFRVGAATRL